MESESHLGNVKLSEQRSYQDPRHHDVSDDAAHHRSEYADSDRVEHVVFHDHALPVSERLHDSYLRPLSIDEVAYRYEKYHRRDQEEDHRAYESESLVLINVGAE